MKNDGGESARQFNDIFYNRTKTEILSVLFQSQKLSFESLGIGYVSVVNDEKIQFDKEILNVVIRLLGEGKRIYSYERTNEYSRDSVPSKLNKFLKKVYGTNSYKQIREEIIRVLR